MTKRIVSRKILAFVTAVFTMAVMCGMPAFAFAADSGVTKEETVYVVTDSTGAQTDVIVSDHLVNKDQVQTISDETTLSDIENVKGEETFEQNGEELTWDAGGNSIYYQGTTTEEVPVTMDVTYRLDGEVVSGSELQGKSGKAEITIRYENSAEYEGTTIPFIVMTGLVVTDESFKNIKISKGKVIDDGDKLLVVGMAAPGLAQTLGIGESELGIGSNVVITGDAENFAVEDMMTIVTNAFLEDVDTGSVDLDYDDEIAALNNGAKALADGSNQLYKGLNTLAESMPEMTDGIKALDKGAVELRGSLKKKMKKIASATGELQTGTEKVLNGLKTMKTGLDKGDGTPSNPGAIKALSTIATELAKGAKKAKEGGELLGDSAQLMDGAINGDENSLKALAGTLETATGAYKTKLDQADGSLTELNNNVEGAGGIDAVLDAAGLTAEQKQMIKPLLKGYHDLSNSEYELAESEYNAINKSGQGAKALYNGLTEAPGKIEDAADQMSESAAGLQTAAAGVSTVRDGLKKMSDKLGFYDKDADEQDTLIGGMTVINSGLKKLHDQVAKSIAKTGKLTKALNKLVGGTGELKAGAEEMSDGVEILENGSKELADGMTKLYNEGIKKIVDMYNDDLKGTLNSVDSMLDAGKEYKTFTKLPSGMDGNVKFIYKTDMTQ